jgi:hypothetical protein
MRDLSMKEPLLVAVGGDAFKPLDECSSRELRKAAYLYRGAIDAWKWKQVLIRRAVNHGILDDEDCDLAMPVRGRKKPFWKCTEEELVRAYERMGDLITEWTSVLGRITDAGAFRSIPEKQPLAA